MLVDILKTKVMSRGVYVNPFIGDLSRDFVEAVYKCLFWDRREDNRELTQLLKSWCDFIVDHWIDLQSGKYRKLTRPPVITYKQLLT